MLARLTNASDRILADHGNVPLESVRTLTEAVGVNAKIALPILPESIVTRLGLSKKASAAVRVGPELIPSMVVGDLEIELFGRRHVTAAIVSPHGIGPMVGLVFLQSLDLVLDGQPPVLRPRDPDRIHTEIE